MSIGKRNELSGSPELRNRPGPGAYAAKSFIGEGPKIGMKSRNSLKNNASSLSPGPGSYEPNVSVVIEKAPSVGLGQGKRSGALGNTSTIPGPGHYLVKEVKEGPSFGFGTSKRSEAILNKVPGPGKYELPSTVGELPPHERSKRN
jgi:hypothetical protein